MVAISVEGTEIQPPGGDPPPGRIVHIAVERIAGVGPWAPAN
jgi:hypothetical protein